ncbi:MAG: hypothetical protein WDA18_04160, partial [Candidatus Ratteibacteria bacterium]
NEQRVFFCGVARFSSSGGAGFLIGGFVQKMFELRPKNTAQQDRRPSLSIRSGSATRWKSCLFVGLPDFAPFESC